MSDLKSWSGPDEAEAPDEGSSGYLLMAGVLCGLIIAVGSQALQGHFEQRPALAEADPLLVRGIAIARWLGWALAAGSAGAWVWSLRRVK
jgi:hypothetical protein